MKKLLLAFMALTLIPLSACADTYKEGVHYEVLPGKATATPEVVEFFSFYCGHCYKFEPMADALKSGLKGAKLEKAHVEFLPNGQPKLGKLLSRGFAAAKVLKVEQKVTDEIFKLHFVEKKYVQTVKQLRDAFIAAGVPAKDFDSAYNSFPTNSVVYQMAQKTKNYGIHGTPTVVVNGKYQVKAGGLKIKDNNEYIREYVKLVNYLVTLK